MLVGLLEAEHGDGGEGCLHLLPASSPRSQPMEGDMPAASARTERMRALRRDSGVRRGPSGIHLSKNKCLCLHGLRKANQQHSLAAIWAPSVSSL